MHTQQTQSQVAQECLFPPYFFLSELRITIPATSKVGCFNTGNKEPGRWPGGRRGSQGSGHTWATRGKESRVDLSAHCNFFFLAGGKVKRILMYHITVFPKVDYFSKGIQGNHTSKLKKKNWGDLSFSSGLPLSTALRLDAQTNQHCRKSPNDASSLKEGSHPVCRLLL